MKAHGERLERTSLRWGLLSYVCSESGGSGLLPFLPELGAGASFYFSQLGRGRARHSWGSRGARAIINPECHGPHDWRFPRYCNSGAPKALETCDGVTDRSKPDHNGLMARVKADARRDIGWEAEKKPLQSRLALRYDRKAVPAFGQVSGSREGWTASLCKAAQARTADTRVLRLLSVTDRAVRPVAVLTYASHAVRSAFAGLAALQPAQLCAVHFVHKI